MAEFWNWARTFSCRPRLYVEPTSIESLRSTLKDVTTNRWKVRVIGCGHSPSSLSMCNEVLISMKHFNRIIEIDQVNRQIHCESGVLLRTLNEILPEYHLSLPVQGSVSDITIAGTICTATHGSGLTRIFVSSRWKHWSVDDRNWIRFDFFVCSCNNPDEIRWRDKRISFGRRWRLVSMFDVFIGNIWNHLKCSFGSVFSLLLGIESTTPWVSSSVEHVLCVLH